MSAFWDYVSISLVGALVYPVIRFVETKEWQYLLMFVGMLLADCATKLVKDFTKDINLTCLKRPSNAVNCDIFCRNGNCASKPGFPSGHMTIITFFFVYLYLLGGKALDWAVLSVAAVCVLLMGISRFQKGCHTLAQVICGIAWGAVAAFLWHNISRVG